MVFKQCMIIQLFRKLLLIFMLLHCLGGQNWRQTILGVKTSFHSHFKQPQTWENPSWCPISCSCSSKMDLYYYEQELNLTCVGKNWSEVMSSRLEYSKITNLVLSQANFYNVTEDKFLKFTNLVSLDIGKTNTEHIASTAFSNMKKLRHLYVKYNHLLSWGEAFDNIENLQYLDISYNPGIQLKEIFTKPHHLNTLVSKDISLREISSKTFLNIRNLQFLDISGNLIEKINYTTFEGLKNLTYLSLSYNEIQVISNKSFHRMKSLQTLNLKMNELTELSNYVFDGLKNLESLYVAKNRIKTIQPDAFSSLYNVSFIDLSLNRLKNLSDRTFLMNKQLKRLLLAVNWIPKISSSLFKNLHQLEYLDMSSNKLKIIEKDAFKGLWSIQTIIIRENYLVNILDGIFSHMTTLSVLDLSRNMIRDIEARAFKNLTQLSTLDLSFNDIETLLNDTFSDLSELNDLILRNARVKTLNPRTFAGLSKLRKLDFSDNKINKVPHGLFESLQSLENLDLTNTNFSTAPGDILLNAANLQILNGAGCSLSRPLPNSFRNMKDLIKLNLCVNELSSIQNDSLLGLENLKELSLETNSIHHIAPAAFNHLASLEILLLNGNLLEMDELYSIQFDGKNLTLSNNKFTEINFKQFPNIKTAFLDLSWNYITHIRNFVFMPALNKLDISANRLDSNSVLNLANLTGLETIVLSQNQIKIISDSYFHHLGTLSRLTTMFLDHNWMQRIAKGAFKHLGLTNLHLSHNNLIHIDFLRSTKHLKKLYLNHNRIEKLFRKNIMKLKHLEILDLCRNKINQVEANLFSNLHKLKHLNLSSNHLMQLPTGIFSGLEKLNTLKLVGCQIENLTNLFPTSISGLKYLYLQDNIIEHINIDTFIHLKKLSELYLDNNRLISSSAKIFTPLRWLKVLSLNNNVKFGNISLNSLRDLKALMHLKISNVGKITTERGTHGIFSKIESLDISYNNLTSNSGSMNSFISKELRSINISGNQLTKFPDGIEKMLHKKLHHLNFSDTGISVKEIENNLNVQISDCQNMDESERIQNSCDFTFDFSKLKWIKIPKVINHFRLHLTHLYLSHNNLQRVDISNIFPSSDTRLRQLDLSYNKLNSLTNIQRITFSNLNVLDVSNNNLSDICSISWVGFAESLRQLYLDRNNINTLKETCFQGLNKLYSISLKENSIPYVAKETFYRVPGLIKLYSSRTYLCCMVPASVKTCYPLRRYDGLSTCDGLLSHFVLQAYIWLIGCTAFIGNIAVFSMHVKETKCKKNGVPSFLIANLAVADFSVANYMLIIAISDRFYSNNKFGVNSEQWLRSMPCLFACFICCAASLMSVFMMLIISIDRFICMVYPFSKRKLTLKSALLLVMGFWLFSITFVGVPVVYSIGADGDNRLHGYSSICMSSNVLNPYFKMWITAYASITIICWIITCFLYTKMLNSIRQTSQKVRKSENSKDKRITIRLFLILITDLISWIPYYIIFMQVLHTSESVNILTLQFVIIFALPINSAVNPCLYTLSSQTVINYANSISSSMRSAYQIVRSSSRLSKSGKTKSPSTTSIRMDPNTSENRSPWRHSTGSNLSSEV